MPLYTEEIVKTMEKGVETLKKEEKEVKQKRPRSEAQKKATEKLVATNAAKRIKVDTPKPSVEQNESPIKQESPETIPPPSESKQEDEKTKTPTNSKKTVVVETPDAPKKTRNRNEPPPWFATAFKDAGERTRAMVKQTFQESMAEHKRAEIIQKQRLKEEAHKNRLRAREIAMKLAEKKKFTKPLSPKSKKPSVASIKEATVVQPPPKKEEPVFHNPLLGRPSGLLRLP
jgi:hypothetical protein